MLVLIGLPVLEVLVFVEVGRAIGWPLAFGMLIGTSVLGAGILRGQGRSALTRVSLAVSERRAPARAAIESVLGLLGGILLVIPGFVTDVLGVLLVFSPTRALARRWISRRYVSSVMTFIATAGRFASGRRDAPIADVEATAIEEDHDLLGR